MQIERERFVSRAFLSDGSNDFSATKSNFEYCRFEGMFAPRARSSFSAISSSFSNCQFVELEVDCFLFGGGRVRSRYEDCEFAKCELRAPAGGRARFERCVFRRCLIRELFSFDADFIDCIFDDVTFNKTVFSARPVSRLPNFLLRRNKFSGNDFRTSTLRDVAFRGGIDLEGQHFARSPHTFIFDLRAGVMLLR
jgi:uncharacterized protein YjbI with pentapeptide repeats